MVLVPFSPRTKRIHATADVGLHHLVTPVFIGVVAPFLECGPFIGPVGI